MKFSNLLPDFPATHPQLLKTFQQHHERYQQLFPAWSLSATRRKLIAGYWLEILHKHFFVLMSAGVFLSAVFNATSSIEHLMLPVLPVSILVFLILFFTMYWPVYHLDFLPHLDSCVESFRGQQLEAIQKCKKQQYSVVALMLIHHIYQKMARLQPVLINTGNAQLLARQYGISIKSICPALLLIQRGEWDRDSIRKRTETLDDFEAAKEHFRFLQCDDAILMLERLQQKILQRGAVA